MKTSAQPNASAPKNRPTGTIVPPGAMASKAAMTA